MNGEDSDASVAQVDLSVVVPVRNGAAFIGQQLAALADQRTDMPWEIVIADNGSTDKTRQVVESWRGRLRVSLTIVEAGARPGAAYARNAGAAVASGQVLAFCDCDDQVSPDWVAQAAEAVRASGVAAGLVHPPGRRPLNPEVLNAAQTWRVLGSNFVLHRAVFDEVGGFDENLGPYAAEDADLSLRLRDAGHVIASAPGMVVLFRPTRSPFLLLRKVINTGRGEVLIQAKRGGPLPTVGDAVSSLLRWPVAAAARLLAEPSLPSLRRAGRDLVVRVGHVVGRLELARTRVGRE